MLHIPNSFHEIRNGTTSTTPTRRKLEATMSSSIAKVRRFLRREDGPTAVEYAVMLALIIVVCLAAVQTIGKNASSTFRSVSNQLGGS